MTAFDAHEPPTAQGRWARSPRLAALARVPVPGRDRRIVLLAAHPDDETLGAGGLLAAAAVAGLDITVVIATDGDASHPHSPTHTAAVLARIRRQEANAALASLAPRAQLRFLGLPDGRLFDHGELLREELRSVVQPATLLLSTYREDRHPDHEACGLAAADVAAEHGIALWEFPIWTWHWADPDAAALAGAAPELPWSSMRRFDLPAPAREAKSEAMRAYVSQHSPLSDQPGDEAILPDYMLEHFQRSFETFIVTAPAAKPRYFDQLYATDDDPWGLGERFYEQRKRDIVLASLPRSRFRRAFEPGCAVGLHTVALAQRCDEVVAWDIAERAVEQTRRRVAAADVTGSGSVAVALGSVPAQWPDGVFDLIVLSEIGYFITDVTGLAQRVAASLSDDGVLVACHWRHPTVEAPSTTEAVHAALGEGFAVLVQHVEEDFLLQIWSRTGESVARAAGIVG